MSDITLNGDVLIDVQHVTYTHWNQTEPTLRDVSLQIRRGSLNVLVGPSGSGKSTLCDLFNGVIPHLHGGKLEGDVSIAGQSIRQAEVKTLAHQVGRVFQDPEVMFAMLYVEDEIAFGPENLRLDTATIQEIVEQLLAQTDLQGRRKNLVWNLSGGQVQKLGLATVLAMRPQMIVLDEPTSNLDPGATHNVHQLILQLRDQGITVLLVTRELDEFLAEADQLLVLEDGHIRRAGPPRQVLAEDGPYMVASLGVWLPETSEIGIQLSQSGCLPPGEALIAVDETLDALSQAGLLTGAGNLSHPPAPSLPWAGREGERAAVSREAPPATPPLSQPELGPEKEGERAAVSREAQPASPPLSFQERGPGGEVNLLISAANLSYRYPSGVQALKSISLDIHAGEWLMIVGRNGAGKSTLSRLLVGLSKPQDGGLTLFGRDARQWKVPDLANHIALVFQNPEHQFLTDTVADELAYSLLAKGITDPRVVKERTQAMLHQLGLQDFTAIHPLALSAGLKRRLGVATMLVGQPRLLLVDEPTYGQDKAMTHTLMALMQQIRAQGVSVVMITHDMRLVQEYAERVVVMSDGQILFDGASSALFEQDDVLRRANLRRTLLHDLLRAMNQHGMPVEAPIRCTADLVRLLQGQAGKHPPIHLDEKELPHG